MDFPGVPDRGQPVRDGWGPQASAESAQSVAGERKRRDPGRGIHCKGRLCFGFGEQVEEAADLRTGAIARRSHDDPAPRCPGDIAGSPDGAVVVRVAGERGHANGRRLAAGDRVGKKIDRGDQIANRPGE